MPQRWENQLIGWTSTADPLENVARASLFFYTKEEAMDFCTKHGWEYSVDMPNERKHVRTKRFNAYGESATPPAHVAHGCMGGARPCSDPSLCCTSLKGDA